MKIQLLFIGKTEESYLKDGINVYLKRLRRYMDVRVVTAAIPGKWNNLPVNIRKDREAGIILKHMAECDQCILLDEKGRSFTSMQFARFIEEKMNRSTKSILFVVGGPWGFSPEVRKNAAMHLSLSPLTFSHQMVRLLFLEQLYRAMTIIRGEPYHNE